MRGRRKRLVYSNTKVSDTVAAWYGYSINEKLFTKYYLQNIIYKKNFFSVKLSSESAIRMHLKLLKENLQIVPVVCDDDY